MTNLLGSDTIFICFEVKWRGTKDEKQKRSKINKKGIIVTLIVLVALATTITVWKALEDKKQEKLFSKEVAEKQAEKEKTLKSIDYKTIINKEIEIEEVILNL